MARLANPVTHEPVVVAVLAGVLTYLAGNYGLDLSAEQAAGAAIAVLGIVTPFARELVRPVRKRPPPA